MPKGRIEDFTRYLFLSISQSMSLAFRKEKQAETAINRIRY
jgi:hypothetical protein